MGHSKTPLPEGDERHGTVSGYVYWQCKCAKCRASWAAYYRARRKGRGRWRRQETRIQAAIHAANRQAVLKDRQILIPAIAWYEIIHAAKNTK